MTPIVSIILPSLNVAGYIEECIKSAISQTLTEIEIIIIDAGSTDGTWEIEQQYASKDARIVLLQSEKKSYGYQCNQAIERSRGEYIAILETDDYVVPEMYERLYSVAQAHNLDYVKADCDTYYEQINGERFFWHRKSFGRNDLYDCELTPRKIPEIPIGDWYLWQGIYRKSFLEKWEIRFNESKGAAYQDIGFLCQTTARAEKAMYLRDSLYRYCIGRAEASSNLGRGLINAKGEYERILTMMEGKQDPDVLRSIHIRMVKSFVLSYNEIRDMGDIDNHEGRAEEYHWFCNQLRSAIEKGLITEDNFSGDWWKKMQLLLKGEDSFWEACKSSLQRLTKKISQPDKYRLVIFGCGNEGLVAYRQLTKAGYPVDAFMDNNSALWGNSFDEIPILQPAEKNLNEEQVILIANELRKNDIHDQLLSLGVKDDRIVW